MAAGPGRGRAARSAVVYNRLGSTKLDTIEDLRLEVRLSPNPPMDTD